jgi:flotillin
MIENAPLVTLIPVLMALAVVLIVFSMIMLLVRRYKRCPSNRILVIYGKVKAGRAARTLHGGGAFVWPLIQAFEYLSLDPMQIEIPLQGALSIENIRVNVPSVFTVAIGTDEEAMTNAAIRLLGQDQRMVMKQAEDIILGQLRQVIASMRIEDINRDRDLFLNKVQTSLEPELKKIGLVLINVNIKDITDESGYIEAIGRKAASQAIQQAKIDVAEQEKLGSIGVADAERERQIQVASAEKLREIGTKEADRDKQVKLAELGKDAQVGQQRAAYEQEVLIREADQAKRIRVAEANAAAVAGENKAKADIAQATADLRVREADAFRVSETRQREADAQVREAQYLAEARAADAQAKKLEAEKRAELEAVAKAMKAQVVVDAEAAAERVRIAALAEAGAIYAKLEAEARGQYEILAKKGEGMKTLIESCGGAQQAFQMLMLEHLDTLSANAASAIANIKFDKVVVWDGGNGTTASFLQSLAGALPPTLKIMKDIAGVDMPEYFGRLQPDAPPATGGAAAGSPSASAPRPTV